jgi:hypothetical protein
VRVRPFPAETFTTPDEANARAIELRRLRAAGIRHAPRITAPTLAEAAESLLVRKRVAGRRGPLTSKGIRHWEDATRPWRDRDFADVPLDLLRRSDVEDILLARAAARPVSARNELQALKAMPRPAVTCSTHRS